MSSLTAAIEDIIFARNYTIRLLDAVDQDDWFRMPADGVSHIAWQVGHLAFGEYRMALDRLRGVRPEDANLISESFLIQFGRDSVADADPAKYPSIAEIRAVFDRVHEQTLLELRAFPEEELDHAPTKPHRLATTKLECLRWCSHHEMVHAGQIGLLRRLLGKKYVW